MIRNLWKLVQRGLCNLSIVQMFFPRNRVSCKVNFAEIGKVRDIVDAVIRAAEIDAQMDQHALNIGSGIETSLEELIHILAQITGKRIQVNYTEERKIDVPVNIMDIRLARDILGWKPTVSLEGDLR